MVYRVLLLIFLVVTVALAVLETTMWSFVLQVHVHSLAGSLLFGPRCLCSVDVFWRSQVGITSDDCWDPVDDFVFW